MQNQVYPCLQSKTHNDIIMHETEQTFVLKIFSEIEGKQAYLRRKDYFNHFSVSQVIIVRTFFIFGYIVLFFHCTVKVSVPYTKEK